MATISATFLSGAADGAEMIVEKHIFELDRYTTLGGKTIAPVRVGWEAYGTLNEARDNAVLITHYFSGDSHAAGRYDPADPEPGYWDAIIGPGKAIDTDSFYVIASDTLVNLNAKSATVTTTGPATIDPRTGQPWGPAFPVVTIGDFVNVQKALVESLGIKRLYAVAGISMGALQAYKWATAYPDQVERLIAVVGSGIVDANLIGWLNIWGAPIRVDHNWKGGDFYGGPAPIEGLVEALKIVTLQSQSWRWADGEFGRKWASAQANPAESCDSRFLVEAELDVLARARAELSDANHFLYLTKAVQLFSVGQAEAAMDAIGGIGTPCLIVYSADDQLFLPGSVVQTAEAIGRGGTPVTLFELHGELGHLDGIASIVQAAKEIRAILARPV